MQQLTAEMKIIVIGLGKTGLSCIRYLMSQGNTPLVMDTRTEPAGIESLPDGVELLSGKLDVARLLNADLIVVSPGIALATPELQQAASAGIDIIGDIELFAWAVDRPVVAITGSNGKSTVTELLGKMAEAAGIKVGVGGNIGLPALELLHTGCELYILELSSFQLETTSSLKPVAATILNVSEDHMDRYDGMHDYRAAKLRIYNNAQTIVANADDTLTWPDEQGQSQLQLFGEHSGQYHLSAAPTPELMHNDTALLSVFDMAISGIHNQLNALAALALADAANIAQSAAIDTLKHYSGMPHRCEWIANKRGMCWINDSKATNVGATVAALKGLSPDVKGRLHLIVGGDGKGADFSELESVFAQYVSQLYCFGRDASQLAALKPAAQQVENLEQAVELCLANGAELDWVLLSPACASLDMYPNFMARGDHFRRLVEAL